MTEREPIVEDADVVILGGGFAGLLAGAYLKKAGVEGIRVIEMAGDFGGVWYWNRFPGIQCDNDAYCYIPLLEELDFMPSKKFADGAEIFQHCRNIGKHFGLYDGALFSTQVRELHWDDATQRWRISTDRGDDIRARFVVMAQGSYNRPKLPGIPGIKDFAGHVFHSARWDYDYTGGDADGGLHEAGGQARRTRRHRCHRDSVGAAPRPRCPATLSYSSGRRRRWMRVPTRPPIPTGPPRCSRVGRRSASATSTTGRRSSAWCSASRIWCATSGLSSAAT